MTEKRQMGKEKLRSFMARHFPGEDSEPSEDRDIPAVTLRDRLLRFLNSPARTRFFVLLALLCIGISFLAAEKTAQAQGEAAALQVENTRLRRFAGHPQETEDSALRTLFSPADRDLWQSCAEEAGLTVLSVSGEKDSEGDAGETRKIIIKARGSYAQIVETFDIINSKERWSAAYPMEIRREGDHLTAVIGVRIFLAR